MNLVPRSGILGGFPEGGNPLHTAAWTPDQLQASARAVEERLARHSGHLLKAARRLDDSHRRRAFLAVYYWVRVAGPACLPRPLGRSRSVEGAGKALRQWRDTARLCSQGQPDPAFAQGVALTEAMETFQLPFSPWLDLEKGLGAMARGEPVPDLAAFVLRARQVALPAARLFFRILCARRGHRRYHLSREIDIDELAHDPALFAYCVGTMCDVFSELEHLKPPRTSLPRDLLERHNLSLERLQEMRGMREAPRDFRELMRDLATLARNFYESGMARLTQAAAHLSPEAIRYLDGFLDHYKDILRDLEAERFRPAAMTRIQGGFEPRLFPSPRSIRAPVLEGGSPKPDAG